MPPAERGPGAPVTTCLGLRRNTTHVVKRELKTGTLGASVYLVPGWFPAPRTPSDDVARQADLIFQAVERAGRQIDAKPLVAYVPVRSGDLENGHSYLSQLHGSYEGLYLQISPIKPYTDPTHR